MASTQSRLLSRSWLYVPGDRPDRFEKAIAAARGVIFDLEDAVVPAMKGEARQNVIGFLSRRRLPDVQLAVRISPPSTRAGLQDLLALLDGPRAPDALLLPKVENEAAVQLVDALLSEASVKTQLFALIESAAGVARANAIAQASSRLTCLMFGAADYGADIGMRAGGFERVYAWGVIVNSAAAAGLVAIDSPSFVLGAPAALEEECCNARRHGFFGKAAIHPQQIPIIERAFAPTSEELREAERILDVVDGRAMDVDGKMVDVAMLRWAKRLQQTPE